MFWFILTIAVVFGIIMGTREALIYAQGTGTVEDARRTGLIVGFLFSVYALVIMLCLWAGGAAYWWLINLS